MIRNMALSVLAALVSLGPAQAQSVDEIIGKHLQALGGIEKLRALQSKSYSGPIELQGGAARGILKASEKRPNLTRVDIEVFGSIITQAFDGKEAWMIQPPVVGGTGLPQDMPPAQRANMIDSADFDGPLLDYRKKGHQVVLKGIEQVTGSDAFHLEVTLASGRVQHFFISTDNFYLIKVSTKQPGTLGLVDSYFTDYREVRGLMMPHGLENKANGQTLLKLTVDRFVLDKVVDDAQFSRPSSD